MASLLLAAPNAFAGSYSPPIYSGSGTATQMVNNTPAPTPYGPTASGWGGGSGGVRSASCTGTIAASFKWQPAPGYTMTTDPQPTQVVVTETCTTSTAVAIPYQTGAWNTGLGVPGSTGTVTCIPGGSSNSVSTTSVHYTPATGGPTVSLPKVSPSSTGNGIGSSCTVSYTAAISPVFAIPTGAVKDNSGNYNILIGQHCRASLSGVPGALLNNTANPPTYQWSVSGTTLQTWQSQTPAIGSNPFNPDATYYVSGPGPLTNPTASWYWNDLSDGKGKSYQETVSCTATVTPPAGQGGAFSVTATQPVTVWTPAWTCTGTGGVMQVNTANSAHYASLGFGNATDFFLYAGPSPGSGETGGMDWYAIVATPNPSLFGNGSLVIAQLIIPDLSYTTVNFLSISSTRTWSQNGEEVLDSYPYVWTTGAPSYFGGDSPGIDLSSPSSIIAAHVGDQFEDYLMYFAPGSVQCVPVAHFVWSTNGNASIASVAAGWASFGTGSAGAVTPSGTPTKFSPSNSFPMWIDFYGDDASF